MRQTLVLAAVALSFAACGPERSTQTDSSGGSNALTAEVVESDGPSGEADAWTLSDAPLRVIGKEEGEPDELLHRVSSAMLLESDEIMLSNAGTYEVRAYVSDGTVMRRFGSEGQGPGEFSDFAAMRMYRLGKDSVVVGDESLRRMHVFRIDGTFGRTISVEAAPGFASPSLIGVFADGGFLAVEPEGSSALRGEVGDRIDMRFGYFRYDRSGGDPMLLSTRDEAPRIVNAIGDGGRHFPYVPLSPHPVYATDGDDFLIAGGLNPEFHRVNRAGETVSVVRWAQERVRVRDVWSRFVEESLDGLTGEWADAYTRLYANPDLPLPEFVPAVEEIVTDALGYVWVREYNLPWQEEARWQIFDSSGRWLGGLTMPVRFSVLEIGRDYVLGRHVDDAGVQRVMLFGLNRPSSPTMAASAPE